VPAAGRDERIRVLCVDDHPLLREGIAATINGQSDMTLIAEAATGREAIEAFRTHRPDVVLMDIRLPDMSGIDATIAIRVEFPDARIVVVTTFEGDSDAQRALQAGARAYLLKSMVRKDLVETIRLVHAGKIRVASSVAARLAEHLTDDQLTPREIEVLELVATGHRNRQIAARLTITEETVKVHVKNVIAKLGANDRTHAVTIALQRGIIRL
jgi:DNA-binding NarL/FixJ family response regulator